MKSMFETKSADLSAPPSEIFSMQAETYANSFALLAPRLVICHRQHEWRNNIMEEIDTLGPFWALATFPRPLTKLSFWGPDKREHPVGSDVAVFVPPFSLFSTHIGAGHMEWLAVASDLPLPPNAPRTPVMMPWNGSLLTNNVETLFANIQNQRNQWINIEKRNHASRLALKAKQWIDEHFRSECNLKEMSDSFGVDQSVLGRDFKTCYGVSPSVYRKKLRIMTAMISLVVEGLSVTEAGSQAGFSDLDHFTKQFRSTLLALPSQFKASNKKKEAKF